MFVCQGGRNNTNKTVHKTVHSFGLFCEDDKVSGGLSG